MDQELVVKYRKTFQLLLPKHPQCQSEKTQNHLRWQLQLNQTRKRSSQYRIKIFPKSIFKREKDSNATRENGSSIYLWKKYRKHQ